MSSEAIDLLESDRTQLTPEEIEMIENISSAKKERENIDNDDIKPIGLYEDLSEELKEEARAAAKRILCDKGVYSIEKNLMKDLLRIDGQNFCVVSWVGPTLRAKTNVYGFRILGAFKTLNKAINFAKYAHSINNTYDIGVVEMYSWCFSYPIVGEEVNEELNKKINDIIVNHKFEIEESKQLFEIRKRALKKSTYKKETEAINIEPSVSEVSKGLPSEKAEELHKEELKKWGINCDEEEDDNDEYENTGQKQLDFECSTKIPNQEWAIVSFVGNKGKNGRPLLKIVGIFANESEAEERIKQLMEVDDTYDFIPMPLYKWVPCDPNVKQLKYIYKNNQLNRLLTENEKQKEKAMSYHHTVVSLDGKQESELASFDDDGDGDENLKPSELLKQLEDDVSNLNFTMKEHVLEQ